MKRAIISVVACFSLTAFAAGEAPKAGAPAAPAKPAEKAAPAKPAEKMNPTTQADKQAMGEKAAAAGGAMAMPKPQDSEQFKEYSKFFVGTWTCESKWNASPMAPAHSAKATVSIKTEIGGTWIVTDYKESKSKENPMPFEVMEHVTSDGKGLVHLAQNNFGGASTQTGMWEGDTLSFKGEDMMMGMKGPSSLTFTKKGPKALTFAVTGPTPDGKSAEQGTGECKKK